VTSKTYRNKPTFVWLVSMQCEAHADANKLLLNHKVYLMHSHLFIIQSLKTEYIPISDC